MIAIADSAERPLIRTPEELRVIVERLRSDGYEMDRVNRMLETADEKQKLVEQLQSYDPELNGEANLLAEDIGLYKQELETKKTWNTWEFVKSIPGRVWGTIKAHPYATAAVAIGLGLAGAYYYYPGAAEGTAMVVGRVRDWLGSYFMGAKAAEVAGVVTEKAGEAVGAAQEAVGTATEGATEVIGDVLEAAPLDTPPAIPLPDPSIPSLEEAGKILEGIDG